MTHPDATSRRSTTYRFTPGTPVHIAGTPEVGIVVQSDEWWDTFQLRGVPASAQVLVEWPRGGNPVKHWIVNSDLREAKK